MLVFILQQTLILEATEGHVSDKTVQDVVLRHGNDGLGAW